MWLVYVRFQKVKIYNWILLTHKYTKREEKLARACLIIVFKLWQSKDVNEVKEFVVDDHARPAFQLQTSCQPKSWTSIALGIPWTQDNWPTITLFLSIPSLYAKVLHHGRQARQSTSLLLILVGKLGHLATLSYKFPAKHDRSSHAHQTSHIASLMQNCGPPSRLPSPSS